VIECLDSCRFAGAGTSPAPFEAANGGAIGVAFGTVTLRHDRIMSNTPVNCGC
jgi:hypothetical protein